MTNELATLENDPVALNKAFGFQGRPKPPIPVLRINGADESTGTAPKGTFVLDDGDKILYANEIDIRSFLKAYQYRIFDKDNKEKNDTSTIEMSFKGEFRSMSGRFACGKMNKKKFLALGDNISATQKYLQDNVKCKLLVFGLVSGKFIDIDTKREIEVKDELFSWVVSQSGFMSLDQAITGIEKERRAVALTPIHITLKKEKMGSVTYFVPVPAVTANTEKLDVERDGNYLLQIKSFIKDTNSYVNDKYNAANKVTKENTSFVNVGTILDQAGQIIDDPINDL